MLDAAPHAYHRGLVAQWSGPWLRPNILTSFWNFVYVVGVIWDVSGKSWVACVTHVMPCCSATQLVWKRHYQLPPQPHGHSLLSTHLGQQAGILGGDLTYLLKATVRNSNLNANRFDQFVFNSEIYIHRFDSLGCLLDCSKRRRNVGDEEPSICIGGAKCCRPMGGCVELPRGRCSWRLAS